MSPSVERDIAVSFLFKDEGLARELVSRLEGYRVFFFPKAQEDLAGTDGMESFREEFRTKSLLNVVLYRDGWGDTPWTRIEQTGIQEAFLSRGWDSLLFVTIDEQSTPPKWVAFPAAPSTSPRSTGG